MRSVSALLLHLLLVACATEQPFVERNVVEEVESPNGLVRVTANGQSAEFHVRRYGFLRLQPPARAYTQFPKGNLTLDPQDSLGVPVQIVKGATHYHPVFASWRGLQWADNGLVFKDSAFLKRAEVVAVELVKRGTRSRNAIYYPYTFDYAVLGLESETMEAPWYSGMAQGRMLSLLVKLYEITRDPLYRAWADSTFTSFLNYPDGTGAPATVFVDPTGFFWIEEYPHPSGGNMVANGHAYGIYGLYDYVMLTGNATARTLLQAAITTTHQYAGIVRNPGAGSYYSVKHKMVATAYHLVNVQNLTYIAAITNDASIRAWRDLYQQDKAVTGFLLW